MKTYLFTIFLLLVIMHLASPGGMVFAQPDEIVRDSDMMPLFPDLEAGKGDAEKKKSGRTEWETVDIKLFRVTPVSGNNPFHTREPVRNFNGETYPTITAIKQRARGQTTAHGGGCNPSTATARVTARNASQGVCYTMDTAAGTCKVTADTHCPNSAFFVDQRPAVWHPNQLRIQEIQPAIWRITQFPPCIDSGATWCLFTPGTYDLVLLEVATGRQWRINISFTGNGVDPWSIFNYASFTVTINSVTALN
jgi:hypothetical protein